MLSKDELNAEPVYRDRSLLHFITKTEDVESTLSRRSVVVISGEIRSTKWSTLILLNHSKQRSPPTLFRINALIDNRRPTKRCTTSDAIESSVSLSLSYSLPVHICFLLSFLCLVFIVILAISFAVILRWGSETPIRTIQYIGYVQSEAVFQSKCFSFRPPTLWLYPKTVKYLLYLCMIR